MLRLRILCGALGFLVLAASGCGVPPETRAGRDLADTVKIKGYRKLSTEHAANTTLLYFVGPAGVDLSRAVSARNWSPEPLPGLYDTDGFRWVLQGSANTDKHRCRMVVSTLEPGHESAAIDLNDKQKHALVDGKLTYVQVSCFCAGSP